MATTILFIALALSVVSILLILLIFKVLKSNFHYKVIRKHDTPFSFEVKNTDFNDKKKAVLYGTNEYLLTPNFGSDNAIRLNPLASNISYLECLQQSSHQPFQTRILKFNGKINDLKEIMLNVMSKDAIGQTMQFPIFLDQYIHPSDNSIDMNDLESEQSIEVDYKIAIDGNTKIYFDLNPNSKVEMFIFFNTIQYRAMTLFGYLRDLINGNLPKEPSFKTRPSIMPPTITSSGGTASVNHFSDFNK